LPGLLRCRGYWLTPEIVELFRFEVTEQPTEFEHTFVEFLDVSDRDRHTASRRFHPIVGSKELPEVDVLGTAIFVYAEPDFGRAITLNDVCGDAEVAILGLFSFVVLVHHSTSLTGGLCAE